MAWLLHILKPLFSWIVPFILEFVFVKVKAAVERYKVKREEAKADKLAKKEYTEVINNPASTREERKNAEDKYLNS